MTRKDLDLDTETESKYCRHVRGIRVWNQTKRQDVDPSCALEWFVDSRNTSEEDLVVIVVEHDITSHKEGDTTKEMELQDWPKMRKIQKMRLYTQNARKKKWKRNPGRPSAYSVIPYFLRFPSADFPPVFAVCPFSTSSPWNRPYLIHVQPEKSDALDTWV